MQILNKEKAKKLKTIVEILVGVCITVYLIIAVVFIWQDGSNKLIGRLFMTNTVILLGLLLVGTICEDELKR